MNKGLAGKISIFFIFLVLLITSFAFFNSVLAEVNPGELQGYNFCGGSPCPTWVNLTRGDMFFADGDSVYIIANISCSYPHICNSSMLADANFSEVGGSELRAGALKEIGGNISNVSWAIFEFNDTVNFSSLSIQQIQPKNITMNASIINNVTELYDDVDLPSFIATVLLVNMSTFGCPPSAPPGGFPWVPGYNISAGPVYFPIQALACTQNTTLCSFTDAYGPGTWDDAAGQWKICAPTFGGATTNFTEIASTGNFSAIPNFTIEVPGKAKIVFQTNVSFDSQEKSRAIMEFAMKSAMSGGRIGINDTEYNGQGNRPNLNLTARLTIYNVSGQFGIANPQIMRTGYDGSNPQSCGPICSGVVWDGQNITFTVSSFSSYTATDAINVTLAAPNDTWVNNKSVNFTFVPVWNASMAMSNCTLYGNFSGSWESNLTNSTPLVNGVLNGISNTMNADGAYIWNVECYDNTGLGDTGASNYTVKVDSSIPRWSGSATSDSAYSPGKAYQFNVTWNDSTTAISSVLIEHNFSGAVANYSVVTNSSNVYYYGFNDIPAGTYSWREFANDSLNNWNVTNGGNYWTYAVSKASTSAVLLLNGTPANQNSTYPNSTVNATAVSNISGLYVQLWRNGTNVSNATSLSSDIQLLGANDNNFTAQVLGNANYSSSSATMLWWNVSKGAIQVSLYLNGTQGNTTYTYPQSVNATGASSVLTPSVYRDGASKGTGDQILLSNGTYAYKVNATGNENYTDNATGVTYYAFVNKGSPTLNIYIDGSASNATISYPSASNISANESMDGDSDCTYTLWRNNTMLINGSIVWNSTSLGVGAYAFKYNMSGACSNWTLASSTTYNLSIGKGTPAISLTIDASAADKSITYGAQAVVEGSETSSGDADVNYTLYRGSTTVGTGSSVSQTTSATLSEGSYVYVFNSTAGDNYSSTSLNRTLTVTAASFNANTGGGSGPLPEPKTKVVIIRGNANITIPSIAAGKAANVTITKTDDVAFRQVNITVSNSVKNIKLVITKVQGLPSSVTHDITGKTYNYISVDKTNFTDTDVNKAMIKFAVNRTWLSQNGVANSNISLYRWVNDKWIELTTTFVSEDAYEANYQAETPGFSYFLIGTMLGEIAVTPQAPITCTESWICDAWSSCAGGSQTRVCTDSNSCGTVASRPAESRECAVEEAVKQDSSWMYAVALIAILVGVPVILFVFRGKFIHHVKKVASRHHKHKENVEHKDNVEMTA